ncbi:SUMF1/EgtB/PvdO family nonheme iron enzyme [Nocardioides sp. zg-ZUI104]|uniref:SUMF1/EgtB/PvdO family nonheme iron enzyme n=1 Tax=Nocardioides faecalis TaxID=2803858 RepID=UPI001BCC7521|nr:SUMF1/EgtB/PvdO family nonheme iron enzyme [Nocardioides faecalis]MBS4754524.1 SUMF1/EgtB/PvdO family nonheme iron enzyme [Nocardioides faecalis]
MPPRDPTAEPTTRAGALTGHDLVQVPGGEVLMGSARFYPEERPVHRRRVAAFEIDRHPVTVGAFRRFVAATGHVTTAERAPDPAAYPDALPELLVPGAMVFTPPGRPARASCSPSTASSPAPPPRGRRRSRPADPLTDNRTP